MKQILVFALIVALCALGRSSHAQDTDTKGKPKPKRKTPLAFQPPDVDENLPNVLLLGDSISIGYMLDVRKQLAGEANVWRPAINCGPTTRGLKSLDDWIGDKKWAVIHFNFGLHDLKYLGPNGENLANPDDAASAQQVPIDQYIANLKQIAERLKQTGATLIWCETTPVPTGAKGRVPGDSTRYNEAAANVMAQLGDIQVNKLHAFAAQNAEQKKANVHYTPAGSAALAGQVAKTVRAALREHSAR